MKIKMLFLAESITVFLLLIPPSSFATQVYDLTNASPKEQQKKEPTQYVVLLPDGRRVDPWQALPEGWNQMDEESILTREGVIIRKNGIIEFPFGTIPKDYQKKEDGSILTPEGFRLEPMKKEDRRQKKVEKLPVGTVIKPNGELILPQKEQQPEQRSAELWSMLPLSDVSKQQEEPQNKPQKEKPKQKQKPPQPKPKSGELLRITPTAAKSKKIDFLEGCWVSDPITAGTWDDPTKPKTTSVSTLCFNKKGKGQIAVNNGRFTCRGAAKAAFAGQNIKIDTDNAQCPSNSLGINRYTLRHWECVGSGSSTQCFLLSVNPSRPSEVHRFRTHLRRK